MRGPVRSYTGLVKLYAALVRILTKSFGEEGGGPKDLSNLAAGPVGRHYGL